MKIIHAKIWNYLETCHERKKLAQAYLFYGQEGTGKFELALEFVRLVNDLEMKRENIASGKHPDVFIVQPEIEEKKEKRKQKDISIEQLKKVVDNLGLYPFQAPYKFLIIDKADKLTVSASNSLLKLIEEPTSDTIIVLIASSDEAVLPTIRSRCQRIRFSAHPQEAIVEFLSKNHADAGWEKISAAAELSRGRVAKAREYILQPEKLRDLQKMVEDFRSALRLGVGKGLELTDAVSKDKERLFEQLDEWLWYINRFLIKIVREGADIRIQKKTLGILKELLNVQERLKYSNANEKLQLENFFLKIN